MHFLFTVIKTKKTKGALKQLAAPFKVAKYTQRFIFCIPSPSNFHLPQHCTRGKLLKFEYLKNKLLVSYKNIADTSFNEFISKNWVSFNIRELS